MADFQLDDKTRLAIVGCGKMGEAILAGALSSGIIDAARVVAVAPRAARREYLEDEYGIATIADVYGLYSFGIGPSDICLLAVKPQVLTDVLDSVKTATNNPVFVSIAAGITLDTLEDALGEQASVVRVMPNTPALVGKGCSLISGGSSCTEQQLESIVQLFSSFGVAHIIDEKLQNAGSALSGAGPAYFALIINALTRAGLTQGLKREVAQDLSVATMAGTAGMLEKLEMHPEQLIDMVTSPGGTTIAAVNVLENYKLRAAFGEAVDAAVGRAEELAWEHDEEMEDEE